MVRIIPGLALLSNVLLALSNPILPTTTVSVEKRAAKYNATELEAEMPSISWEEAISSCTNETRLDILVRAARDVKKMMSGVNVADDRFLYSAAFANYFGDYYQWMSNKNGSYKKRNTVLAAKIQGKIPTYEYHYKFTYTTKRPDSSSYKIHGSWRL
jgi:inosine/xanthosine triphosphate pyrophosphatase family protein